MKNKRQNKKVLILVGCPASGKTTWALNFIQKNSGWVIIGRDYYRHMLKNQGFCEPKIEKLISKMMNQSIIAALNANENVIVDNTHVKEKYINDVIELVKYYADVDYMFFDVPLKTLLERDSARDRTVGEVVIRKMYDSFDNLKKSFHYNPIRKIDFRPYITVEPNYVNDAVIFDLDGTLAHNNHRDYYDFSKVDGDLPNEMVLEQIHFHLDSGRKIIILTGRNGTDECIKQTHNWLRHWVATDNYELICRREDDFRRDSVVKRELYETYIKPNWNVLAVYDDRLAVVEMWHKLGLYVFNCNQGNYDY